jgi:hypothetical protein
VDFVELSKAAPFFAAAFSCVTAIVAMCALGWAIYSLSVQKSIAKKRAAIALQKPLLAGSSKTCGTLPTRSTGSPSMIQA